MSPEYSQILDELESEWNRSGDVNLEEFLRPRIRDINSTDRASASLIALVTEAVQIDMERRANSGSLVAVWTLEDYLKSFPILASPGILESLKLFASRLPAKSERTFQESAKPGKSARANGDNDELGNGDQFGPYQVVREIGRGGMGTVYEALHVHLGKRVALKLISSTVLNDQAAKTRFRREMKAVGMVDHNNVVRAMDAGEVEGSLYLVTEYIAGIDLGKLIREKGPLQSSEALLIVRQAANALQAAHTAGIVHRDVKPSNLLLTETGDVKLLDLGLARVADDVTGETTTTGSIFGTPDYMAPEQWDDVRSVDYRADIYSLGCTLYFLLAGYAPFSGDQYRSPSSKMKAHIDAAIPALPERCEDPEGLVFALVSKMMAKKADHRYATASQIVQVIDNIAVPKAGNSEPELPKIITREGQYSGDTRKKVAVSKSIPVTPESSRPRDSHRTGWWIFAGIVGLVVCGGGMFWWLNSGNSQVPEQSVAVNSNPELVPNANNPSVGDSSKSLGPSTVPGTDHNVDRPNVANPVTFTGNAHRRFAETALRLGRPVNVRFNVDGHGAVLKQPADLPDGNLMVMGNWDCFADSPAWTDEHFRQLSGIHYFGNMVLRGTQVTDAGVAVLKDQDITVDYLTMSQRHLKAINSTLGVRSLAVIPPESGRMEPWPEFFGNQPQLEHLTIRVEDDVTLELIARNQQLTSLELEFTRDGNCTPAGLHQLSKLPLLHTLRFHGLNAIDDLIRAAKDLTQVKTMSFPAVCDIALVKQLQSDRPDLVVIHPELKANESDVNTVRSLLKMGAKVYCYPAWNDVADPVSFDLDGIEWNGSRFDDLETAMLPVRGLKGFSSTSLDAIDMDALAVTLGRQKQLHVISLHGTVSRFSGETIQNLSQLPSLTDLTLNVSGTMSVTAPDLELLAGCRALKLLQLGPVQFDDACLRAISRCTYLMSFTATLTSSATPAGIAELQKLKWLRVLTLGLHTGQLKGEMLQELGRIPSLRQLNLITATPLDQADLAALQKALPRCVILHSQGISFPEDATDNQGKSRSPDANPLPTTGVANPATMTSPQMEPPAIVANAHRRLAETALRFGRPVVVQFDGSGAGEILNVAEDLPDHDFVLPGNWNFFANCPDWKDEHIDLLRGVHLWGDLNLAGTEISPFGMSKLASLDLEVFVLTITRKQLIGLGGNLNATTLSVVTTPDEQASPWPEFLGRQPQLRVFGAGFVNDHLLNLLVQNKRLYALHFMVSDVDPITPGGLKRLAELPCLSQLSLNGKSNADELLSAVEDLRDVKRLNIEYFQCTPEAVKALSASRPDMTIHSPHMDWNEGEYASVKALIQKGAAVHTVPPQINESEKVPFVVDGISCPGTVLGELDSLTAPIRGITGFDCRDMNLADLDQLTEVLSKKESLHQIILTGSVSKFTGATFENLSKLRSLVYLSVGLSGETESLNDEHLLRLRECQALSHLNLHAAPGIDDRGLRALSECSSINVLSIRLHSEASAEGLANLQKLPDLCHLHLSGGNFDNAKLLTLAQIPTLRILNVAECVGEGLTIDGIQKVHEALPKCVIFHGNQILFPDDAK
jgi:serine/threonine protein kinase